MTEKEQQQKVQEIKEQGIPLMTKILELLSQDGQGAHVQLSALGTVYVNLLQFLTNDVPGALRHAADTIEKAYAEEAATKKPQFPLH